MLRRLLRPLCAIFLALASGLPALAECQGHDLIATMAPGDRAALVARADAVPFARGNLWVARRGDQVVTLVGTYHMDDPRHAATLAALQPALKAAHTLLVEAGPDEIAALQDQMRANPGLIVLPPGQSLYQTLPPETWSRLSAALKARGISGAVVTRLRPWYIMMLLSLSSCGPPDGQPGGLDMMLMTAARDRALPVRGLEPAETVFDIFNHLTLDDQVALLNTALAEAATAEDGMFTMAEAYFRGENRLMWEFSAWETARLPGISPDQAARQMDLLERTVITNRNRAWIPVIESAAAEGPVLAGFGALHLAGDDGVLNLLAQNGWAISPLEAP